MATQKIELVVDGKRATVDADPAMPLFMRCVRDLNCNSAEVRLRQGAMRRLHGAPGRRADALVRDAASASRSRQARSPRLPGWARQKSRTRCSRRTSRNRCRNAATASPAGS